MRAVDTNVLVRALDGRRLGEVVHPRTRGPRVPHARHAAPEVRRHVDDRTAVLAHAALEHLARDEEATDEVGAHHRLEAHLADRGQRRRGLTARGPRSM